jgi:hypothetical protein
MAAPGEGILELGTGEYRFEELADAQQIELVHGAQGGYHVWASFRVIGLRSERVKLDLIASPDGQKLQESHVPSLKLELGNGMDQYLGWPAQLAEPACLVGRPLLLRATLTDHAGNFASDERLIVPVFRSGSDVPTCGL